MYSYQEVFSLLQNIISMGAVFLVGVMVGIFMSSRTVRRLDHQVEDLTLQLRLKCSEIIHFSEAVCRLINQLSVIDDTDTIKESALREVRDRLGSIQQQLSDERLRTNLRGERD
jgi:hypothetical protein